jgi:hypothetical protein
MRSPRKKLWPVGELSYHGGFLSPQHRAVARMKLGMSEAGPSQSSPLGRGVMAAQPSLVTFTHDRMAPFNTLFEQQIEYLKVPATASSSTLLKH